MKTHLDLSLPRCTWCTDDETYRAYHDYEWGELIQDDALLFEFVLLEGAQAGLNWLTILKRREAYRLAFDGFNPHIIAQYSEDKLEALMQDPGIIRNRAKIKSAVTNAKAFLNLVQDFGSFYTYTMRFFPGNKPLIQIPEKNSDIPVQNEISIAMSKDMKKRGFTFFGPVICYAHLQATGAINDHLKTCFKSPSSL